MFSSRLGLVAGLVLAITAQGCDGNKDCSDNKDCHQGAKCQCDARGRIVVELYDRNDDGTIDRVKYERDEAGNVVAEDNDWGDDGFFERRAEYSYDKDHNRLGRSGWQFRCDGSKYTWQCTFDEPCAAPYDRCKCIHKYRVKKSDGTVVPCGKPGSQEPTPSK